VTYSSIQGLGAQPVGSVEARRDGSITVATYSSLDSIRGSAIIPKEAQSGLHVSGPTLEDHQGNLWAGTRNGGLVVMIDGRWRVVRKGDGKGVIISLAEDTDHAIWAEFAGAQARLFRAENFQVRKEFKPPQIPAAFSVIADPLGGVWLSIVDEGLMHYQKGEWQTLSMEPLLRKYSRVGGIFNLSVDSADALWGAASHGVVGYRKGNLQLLTERNGLPCESAYATISDLHNNLWILTRCGLVRIANSELERWWADPESRLQISTFTAIDGFRSGIPYNRPAATRSSDGKLWFQNRSVVMMIDPDKLGGNTVVPPVHVEQVIADRRVYAAQNGLRFPPRMHQLELDYTGLSFVAPSKVLFRYMLEGYDSQWQEPGTRRAAFYNDLRPGKYTFRVIACNNSGLWNTEGASLEFDIPPAFYQTSWFRALCGAAFLALLWVFYQFRLRQLEQQYSALMEERVGERTRIARELHDTLLQSLHGVMFQFQAARNMLPRSPENAMKTLDEAISGTRGAIAESRDAIHDLRSQPVAEEDLAQLLEAVGEELAGAKSETQNSTTFRVIVEGEPQKLSTGLQGEVYRIAREVMRNAFRHAGACQIETEIRYDKSQLRLRLRDDGRGIDPKVLEVSRRPGHWGLPGVRERAERIGARLKIWSEQGAGTEIELTVPAAIAYEGARVNSQFKLFRKERKS